MLILPLDSLCSTVFFTWYFDWKWSLHISIYGQHWHIMQCCRSADGYKLSRNCSSLYFGVSDKFCRFFAKFAGFLGCHFNISALFGRGGRSREVVCRWIHTLATPPKSLLHRYFWLQSYTIMLKNCSRIWQTIENKTIVKLVALFSIIRDQCW